MPQAQASKSTAYLSYLQTTLCHRARQANLLPIYPICTQICLTGPGKQIYCLSILSAHESVSQGQASKSTAYLSYLHTNLSHRARQANLLPIYPICKRLCVTGPGKQIYCLSILSANDSVPRPGKQIYCLSILSANDSVPRPGKQIYCLSILSTNDSVSQAQASKSTAYLSYLQTTLYHRARQANLLPIYRICKRLCITGPGKQIYCLSIVSANDSVSQAQANKSTAYLSYLQTNLSHRARQTNLLPIYPICKRLCLTGPGKQIYCLSILSTNVSQGQTNQFNRPCILQWKNSTTNLSSRLVNIWPI
ncbi:uncharacterized protein LOC116407768 [Xenopus tropicalis]|uniref:Uncharacterized protein LOC116407768 n=1 Tax=Xenopus tropicalis TaxID=8364 RepID=A0A8J1IVJ2_XENTR|nr:uncharacterized protein LOC116407768 [Xenopus tropicalis]